MSGWYTESAGCKSCKLITWQYTEWESEFSMKTENEQASGRILTNCEKCGSEIERITGSAAKEYKLDF